MVARYGGDEFMILMPGTSLAGAHRFFERIQIEVAELSRFTLGITLHLSAGAVNFPRTSADSQDLLDAVDEALYVAKRQGKDRLFAVASVGSDISGEEIKKEA